MGLLLSYARGSKLWQTNYAEVCRVHSDVGRRVYGRAPRVT
jgi:hypothetical protein